MEQKTQFRYCYGNEDEQFSFFKIPNILITHEFFRGLSNDAKILYGLLLDRISLSRKNKWLDAENRVYIVCSIDEISKLLHCSRNKAIKTLQELDTEKGIGLVEKHRQGQGNKTLIYVLFPEEIISQHLNADTVSEAQNVNFRKSKIKISNHPKNQFQEAPILAPNNTNNNHTKKSHQDSYRILSVKEDRLDGGSDAEAELKAYQSAIRKNIDYDSLMASHPDEKENIEGIYQLILETVLINSEKILIARNWYPTSLVKSKFMKLNYSHVEYVLDRLRSNTTKIRNIKKYILAALFNAPNTMDSYYRAEVNHDFPQYAAKK